MDRRPLPQPDTGTVVSHIGVMIAVAAVMGLLVAGLAVPTVAMVGYGANAATDSLDKIPSELKAEPLAQRTRVLGAGGNVIATFYDENRVNVPLNKISPIMRKAIVGIEDFRFYEHGAIDLKGTLRAFLTNTTSGSTQGGSSITQQMAKMTLLAQASSKDEEQAARAQTYQRKIKELRHAIAFEQNYSKDWILNRYLNIAYYGSGAYGIQAAAQHYFSTDAAALTLPQAALLAGLVKNPVGYDPSVYPERATARRNVVLARLAQLRVIPKAQADKVAKQPLGLKITETSNGCVGQEGAFFCDYVRRYLLADPSLGATVEERQRLINTGGLTIKTTFNGDFQRAADTAANNHVSATDNAVGALAMIEPGTGNVRAVAQSRPMGRDRGKGETYLNYVVPKALGDANGFQGGSTFKIFVVAAALEAGMPASTTFNSPEELAIPQNEFPTCEGNYPVAEPWVVHNSTSSGVFNMYTGTQNSVNTYFAQLEKATGLCKPFELAQRMGVSLPYPEGGDNHPAQRVPTFTLGVTDVSPLEVANAYATVAARGKYCAPRPVTDILNADGKVFKNYPTDCKQVLTTNTADTINDILKGLMTHGFGSSLQLSGRESAGKTGTTNSNYTVWFSGYTPALATAAVVAGANQQGTPMSLNGQVLAGRFVPSAHGSTTAGPMWADAMRAIAGALPQVYFTPPGTPEPAVPQIDPGIGDGNGGRGNGDGGRGDGDGDGGDDDDE